MKKLLLLLLIIPFVASCSKDDDDDTPTVYEQRLMGELSGYWYRRISSNQIHTYNFVKGEQKVISSSIINGKFVFPQENSYLMKTPRIIMIGTDKVPITIEGDSIIVIRGDTYKRDY